MADSTLPGLLATGDHASRPAANSVGSGALYSCTDHGLVYQSDGSSWSTWATLSGTPTASGVSFTPAGSIAATDVQAAIEEVASEATGGGGLTQAYEGHNSIGATTETATVSRTYVKKITLAEGRLLASVDIYLKQLTAAQAFAVAGVLYDDVSGEPVHLMAVSGDPNQAINPYRVSGVAGDARWLSMPMGVWLPAGDYWIGFRILTQAQATVYYDAAGGSDAYWDAGGNSFYTDAPDTSGTVYTRNDTTRRYSIRANTVR